MNGLIRIGYWHSKDEPYWPDPAWFIDEQWEACVRQAVTAYLRKGSTARVYLGYSWCRFRCERGRHLGTTDLSDGMYIWPSGLTHYLEDHAVRLPGEFVTHVLTGRELPASVDREALGKRPIDATWWCEQRGWHAGTSFRTYADYGEIWAVKLPTTLSKHQIKFLEKFGFYATVCDASELDRQQWSQGNVKLDSGREEKAFSSLQKTAQALGLELIFIKDETVRRNSPGSTH